MRVKITGTGFYAPPHVETAEDLACRIDKDAEWIHSHTGVARRHITQEPVESMAAKAALDALRDREPPDLLLNCSATPRQLIPDSSVFIQRALGWEGLPCHTIHATCLSFLVGLHTAAAFITTGAYRRILLVSSEVSSTSREFEEPESAALLGDGAAAALVEATPEGEASAFLSWEMRTWSSGAHLAAFQGAGLRHHPNDPETAPRHNRFTMDGPRIWRFTRPRAGAIIDTALGRAGLAVADIDLVVPHQASAPALKALRFYGISPDRVVSILGEYGNCIAASLPMALAIAEREGRVKRGDRLMLLGTGAGLSMAAAVIRW
jgi:3-oxoacyl-[acyl-carrier-protein] synthase-3